MKTSRFARPIAAAASLLVVVSAGAVLGAGPAVAGAIGTLTVAPTTGTDLDVPSFNTAGQCSLVSTENIVVRIYNTNGVGIGAGQVPSPGYKNLNGSAAAASYISGGNMSIAAFEDLNTWASSAGLARLNGVYTVTVLCQTSGDTFSGNIQFTPTGATGLGATYGPPAASSTTSVVAQQPAGTTVTSAKGGSTVALRASVTVGAVGNVAFTETLGGGSPVTLGTTAVTPGTGIATYNWVVPAGIITGSYSIGAAFTATTAAYTDSVATPLSFTINKTATAVSSLTLLNLSAQALGTTGVNQPTSNSIVVFKAIVSPKVAGTVRFTYSGGYVTGTVAVSTGIATANWNVPAGKAAATYAVNAVFTPSSANYSASPAKAGSAKLGAQYVISSAAGFNPKLAAAVKKVTVKGYRFVKNSIVTIRVYTTATAYKTIVSVKASATGYLTYLVTLPALGVGQHRIVLISGANSASWWFKR